MLINQSDTATKTDRVNYILLSVGSVEHPCPSHFFTQSRAVCIFTGMSWRRMIGAQRKITFGAYRAMGLGHVLVPAIEPPLVELAFFKQTNVR